MPRDVSLETYRADPLYPRIVRAVARLLARGKVVAPVDVLVEMQLLTAAQLLDWRHGRIPFLERCVLGSLTRLSRLLRILRFHAHDLNLVPSLTAYVRWGKGRKGPFHPPGVQPAVPRGGRLRAELARRGCFTLRHAVARAELAAVLSLVSREPLGVVRALFLDKPPGRSWSLDWHRDLTVALAAGALPSRFAKPTTKAGVPHAEAPVEVLERMLTVRIHIDPVTPDNGPMELVPGSHRDGKRPHAEGLCGDVLLHEAGDALLMRPLVLHRSASSSPSCAAHRRVLHLELAPEHALPDGSRWHAWVPIRPAQV